MTSSNRNHSPSVPLSRAFYERSPEVVARDLLGKLFVHRRQHERLIGRIIEIEAYLGELDAASHAYKGKSPYSAVLFGPAGYTDVFLSYGLHYCVNFSCLPDGQPGGVLVRAVQPVSGLATMARNRGLPESSPVRLLTGGPGKLCQAFGITREEDHNIDVTLQSSHIQVLDDGSHPGEIVATPRIGITKAAELPLRFLIRDM